LVAQDVDVGDRLPAAGQHRRHIDQHPAPVVDRDERAPRQSLGQAGCQPDPVGEQPDRDRTGMTDHPGAVTGD